MSLTLATSLKITVAAGVLAVAGAALPGGATPAEAKKLVLIKTGHYFHHHHGHWRSGIYFVDGSYRYYRSCYWLKVRALETGRQYWWNRYYACKAD